MSDHPDLPHHAQAIVIGGGVMGCSSAYHLARLGIRDTLLLERNQLTSGTTWHSAAQVRQIRSTRNLTRLIQYSARLYAELEAETGQPTGWNQTGSLSIATNADRWTHIRRQSALARAFGVETREVTREELRSLWPLLNTDDVIGAVFSPGDGRVNPSDLCQALVKGARARGARIFENTAVTGFLRRGSRVVGVVTDKGEVRADKVVICGGLWSRAPEVLGRHYEISYPGRQFRSARDLRKGPLHERFVAHKARFAQVFGWERAQYFGCNEEPALTFDRPVWFAQVGEEVRAANEAAAVFDQSTFGKIDVRGSDAETFLDRICANDMRRKPGRAIYTAMLNERGGFESDLTALRLSKDHYRLYVGTTAIKRDLAWLHRHLRDGEQVTLGDVTEDYAVLALMGPKAPAIMRDLGAKALTDLKYFCHDTQTIAGVQTRAARLSYVGETGWELTCAARDAVALFDALVGAGARPAGLLAQTSMRIEKRYLAMGHDLDGDVTPVEAGLEFALARRGDYIGAKAVATRRETGPERRMATIVMDDPQANPVGDEPVYLSDKLIGQVTSAAYGYRVGRSVALAYLATDRLDLVHGPDADREKGSDTTIELDIAGERFGGRARLGAAFDRTGVRLR